MKYIFNKYILIFIGIFILWIGALPYICSKILPLLCDNISYNSHYNVEIINPRVKLSIIPTIKIKASSLKIIFKNNNDYIYIKDPELKFRLLPMLSGRLHVNRITTSEILASVHVKDTIILEKDCLWNLKNYPIKFDSIKIDKLYVEAYGADENVVQYCAKNIFYKKSKKYIIFTVDSRIHIQNKLSEFSANLVLPHNNNMNKSKVDIKITNLDIEPLGNFLRFYLPKNFIKSQGIINLKANTNNLDGNFQNCSILMSDPSQNIIFPKLLNVKSNFSVTSKTIQLNYINIQSKNIHASLKGKITNYLDKALTNVNLSIILDKSRIEDIISLMPPVICEEINIPKLKEYKFFGDIMGNFSIKGDCIEPDLNGNIFISNGILTNAIKNARGATIKIALLGKYLNFDVVVPSSVSEKVWVKGGVELYNVKYTDMRIWSTKNVDLQTAEEKVVPLHEILNFVIGPVPIMDIKGVGNIDITVKGNRKNPHVWGIFNCKNTTAYFKDMPDLVLHNADAELTFNDENAIFKTKKGFVDGQEIEIKGVCSLDGKFDFDVFTKNQRLVYLLNAIKTSVLVEEIKLMLPEFISADGIIDVELKVFGALKDIKDLKFNKNFFTSGKIKLKNDTITFSDVKTKSELKINRANGIINFHNTNANADISAYIKNAPINCKAIIKNNIADINVSISKLNIQDILSNDNKMLKDMANIVVSIQADYKGKVKEIEYEKINFIAKISNVSKNNKLRLSNGEIVLNNNRLSIQNLSGTFMDTKSSFNANIKADKVFSKSPCVSGNVDLRDFELTLLNSLTDYTFIPERFKVLKFNSGKINVSSRIVNNKINAYTDLGGVSMKYIPLDLPVKILNGSLWIKNNTLKANKINVLLDDMPILFDGDINDIFNKRNFDLYINTKPKQDFIDKYINKNQIYPIKIKGDVVASAQINGVNESYNLKANLQLPKEASIYYLGATVGDIENAIILNIDTKVIKQNTLKIKEFTYDKLVSSLGRKETRLNMLKVRGGIEIYPDDLIFNDLHIKTQNPTDARIFNIIFRKPNIKQGQFTSDLKCNGKLSNPKLLGSFHIFETNIPFLDTTMKNITFVFKDKYIELSSVGEVMGNDIAFSGTLKNKLTPPYYIENAQINAKILDLNYIINRLKLSQVDNFQSFDNFDGFNLSNLVIKNLKMKTDSIHLKNIIADNFETSSSLDEKRILSIDEFKFNIANGVLQGSGQYSLTTNQAKLKLKAKEIDANALTYALFDLENQIYGDLTGDISISCNGTNFESCMNTLNGKTVFDVSSGKMPKLGSLEYLLKAGNLLKGGITGVSINSVIDIITPLKTGEFKNIYGKIDIHNGIADNIEIATKGKDLSLFISGTYNCATSIADMEVLGLLSKKISTMFGPLGNLSLNTLFNVIPGVDLSKDTRLVTQINKIPGVELSNKSFRKFIAKIKGNINGDDYVTSFQWIN